MEFPEQSGWGIPQGRSERSGRQIDAERDARARHGGRGGWGANTASLMRASGRARREIETELNIETGNR